jgi:hypothetical protein
MALERQSDGELVGSGGFASTDGQYALQPHLLRYNFASLVLFLSWTGGTDMTVSQMKDFIMQSQVITNQSQQIMTLQIMAVGGAANYECLLGLSNGSRRHAITASK